MTAAADGAKGGIALRRVSPDEVSELRRAPFDAATLQAARDLVAEVEHEGEVALRRLAERFGDVEPGAPLVLAADELKAACRSVPQEQIELLERTATRIRRFALAELRAVHSVDVEVPGGRAGTTFEPVTTAGCYAPGGRHPLPSSVLMTAVTARAAGVRTVVVASPRPAPITSAAAAVAGADCLLAVGGAQAIAALAHGVLVPRCDVVAGPGNRYVTAAKHVVAPHVGIDLLAGPSELVVVADATCDAALVAADLLAQAEHDDDALPILVTPDADFIGAVETELARQLEDLPTRDTAATALGNGFAVLLDDLRQASEVCERLAPEHLELLGAAAELQDGIGAGSARFLGPLSAEVLGDYGAGPNHTLPTGGTARFQGGLSVRSFLRSSTWLALDDAAGAAELLRDSAALADLEGLTGHRRAAQRRLPEQRP